jgi:TolB-like protein
MRIMGKAALLVLLGLGVLVAQPRLAVFEFEPVMTDTGVTRVVASLLRDRLADTKVFSIVLPPAGARPSTTTAADSIAGVLGADQAVLGSVVRIGTSLLISYKLVDVNTGEVLQSDRVTVESESELDVVTERMAASVKERRPYAATLQAGKLTSADLRAREPASSVLFTTGYTFYEEPPVKFGVRYSS